MRSVVHVPIARQAHTRLEDSSGVVTAGLSLPADAPSITDTEEAHATLMCQRADAAPASVDPLDVEVEGFVVEAAEGSGGASAGAGVGGAVAVAAADNGHAGRRPAAVVHVTLTAVNAQSGEFRASYCLRGIDRGTSYRGELHVRVRGVSAVNSPIRFLQRGVPPILVVPLSKQVRVK